MQTTRILRTFRHHLEQGFRSYHAPSQKIPSPATFGSRIPAFHTCIPAIRTPTQTRRLQSTDSETSFRPLTERETTSSHADDIALRKALSPAYQLWFTCKKCLERSGHTVSKQAYHFGTCVINCPKCKSQHLISDHLKIFSDRSVTMEEIANEHGEKLRKGRLGADGDIEFYDDEATAKIEAGEKK